MNSVLFGLAAALGFGSSDFMGGLSSRQIGSLRTVWITAVTSLAVVVLGSVLLGAWWSWEAALFGGLSGLGVMFALVFLYSSLAIGPMSILSPVGAVVGALLPTLWDVATGVSLPWFTYVAIALVIVSVVIVGFSPEENAVKPSVRGVIFAVLAGAGFAFYYILLDLAPDEAGMAPLIANRGVSALGITIAVAAVTLWHWLHTRGYLGREGSPRADMAVGEKGVLNWRKGLPFAVAAGVIEAIGTSLVLYGLVAGNLTVVSVLVSLYPATTILLATWVLKERIAKWQYFGLALAVVAVVVLTLS